MPLGGITSGEHLSQLRNISYKFWWAFKPTENLLLFKPHHRYIIHK